MNCYYGLGSARKAARSEGKPGRRRSAWPHSAVAFFAIGAPNVVLSRRVSSALLFLQALARAAGAMGLGLRYRSVRAVAVCLGYSGASEVVAARELSVALEPRGSKFRAYGRSRPPRSSSLVGGPIESEPRRPVFGVAGQLLHSGACGRQRIEWTLGFRWLEPAEQDRQRSRRAYAAMSVSVSTHGQDR